MKQRKKIIFRVDGNKSIGYGHLFRCMALAEILKTTFDISFYSSVEATFLIEQIKHLGELVLLPEQDQYYPDEISSNQEINFDLNGLLVSDSIVVLDGYRFGSNYRKEIKRYNCTLICIEDIPSGFYPADVIVSSNPLFTRNDFQCSLSTKCYFGIQYSLMRKPFRESKKIQLSEKRILIAMGGVDQHDITTKLVQKLLNESKEQLTVVFTNGYNQSKINLLFKLKTIYPDRLNLYSDIDADRMVVVMDSCDRAVLPSSGVLIEALSRGLTIFAGYYSKNQRKLYEWFVSNSMINPIGDLCQKWPDIIDLLKIDTHPNNFSLEFKTDSEWIQMIQKAVIKKDETAESNI